MSDGSGTRARYMELPRFLRAVEGDAALLSTLGEVATGLGVHRLCTVSGPSASSELAERICAGIPGASNPVVVRANGEADVEALLASEELAQADALLAVGGGRTIDVAKAAALTAGIPVISCPTQLTADGIASPVAVIATAEGVDSRPGRLPAAVVCDVALAAAAPIEATRAGLGDLLSNITALDDWEQAARDGEAHDDFAALLARSASDLALGAELSALGAGRATPELARRLLEGLVLSGLAMEIAGSSRPCSGAEHLVSHSLDRVAPGTALHGEQVAFGTIVAARLQGGDWSGLRETLISAGLDDAVRGFGLPLETLVDVVRLAPATRPGRRTVLDRIDLEPASLAPLIAEVTGL